MKELEKTLRKTFEDYRLSKDEKYAFRDLLQAYRDDVDILSFVRNTAFDMAGEHMRKQQTFDANAYRWLEHIIKSIDSTRASSTVGKASEAYFSPGTDCKDRIISLIDAAEKDIGVCVFTISDNDISHSLHRAHERGIPVRIITDNDKANDTGSDVEFLARKGLKVVKDRTRNHMHHKFCLVDQTYLINGSFNWTRSASKHNDENITILFDPELIEKFSRKFEEMWRAFGSHN